MDARLVKAATTGDVDVLRQPPFTNSDILLSQETPLGNTALHIAVKFGRKDFALEIYQRNHLLIRKKNFRGDTPLHIAARAGHFSILNSLVEKISSGSPLRDVEHGELQLGDMLRFQQLQDILRLQLQEVLRMTNVENNTALHEAIRNRRPGVVKLLTEADPELWCYTNNTGESPLYLATQAGFEEIVRQTFQRQAASTIAYGGPNGKTALHAAVIGGQLGITIILVTENKELVKGQDGLGQTALHYAASMGDLMTVQLLLECDSSIAYLLDTDGQSPLHKAAINGHINIIQALLKQCPDCVDLLDGKGQNVLHTAIKSKQLEVVRYLLGEVELEGLINQADKDGNTPLHVATMHCHFRMVSALTFEDQVDMRAMNNEGLTALDIVELNMEQRRKIFQKFLVPMILRIGTALRNQPPLATEKSRHAKFEVEASSSYKEMVRTPLVVATLIATIACAAALTMPGGLKSDGPDQGTATLIRKSAFEAFVIFDAFAIGCSLPAVFLLLWTTIVDSEGFVGSVVFATFLTWLALVAMAGAFATGFYAVLSSIPWLAIFICSICCGSPFLMRHITTLIKARRLPIFMTCCSPNFMPHIPKMIEALWL